MRPSLLLPVLAVGACAPLEVFDDPTKVAPTVEVPPDTDDAPVRDSAEPVVVDTGDPRDRDADGVIDDLDNCVDDPNTDQADRDQDDVGDVCDDDIDGDMIPNDRDLFPEDGSLPGVASQDHVYAHGPNDLWRYVVPTRELQPVGRFTFDQSGGSVTDVAIDRYGVLYAVTFADAFVCSPDTAQCWWIGDLVGSYNGLTFVPDDLGVEDVLVGISTGGSWTAYLGVPHGFTAQPWGGYGQYGSSGDVFHVRYTGTYGAVTGFSNGIGIVEVNTHGQVLRTVTVLENTGGVFGLAGAANRIFAFASNGQIIQVDPTDGASQVVANGIGWWGAGVKTIVVP